MKYHFRITKLDDGRFLAQSIEHFYCSVSFENLADAAECAHRRLHKHLSVPPVELLFASPVRGSLEEIKDQYIRGGIDIIAVPVEPATALAITLRRLRANRGLCQKQIAKRMGIRHLSNYQRLEDPLRTNPTLWTLTRLQRVHPKLDISSLFESTTLK